jgi:hypothetical protein
MVEEKEKTNPIFLRSCMITVNYHLLKSVVIHTDAPYKKFILIMNWDARQVDKLHPWCTADPRQIIAVAGREIPVKTQLVLLGEEANRK